MSPLTVSALVAMGGAAGALARYWTGTGLGLLLAHPFPVGTFAVNVAGSFAIGVLATVVPVGSAGHALLVVGVLGGFTTFSAFSLETVRLLSEGRAVLAGLYVVSSIALCVVAAFAGFAAGRALG